MNVCKYNLILSLPYVSLFKLSYLRAIDGWLVDRVFE